MAGASFQLKTIIIFNYGAGESNNKLVLERGITISFLQFIHTSYDRSNGRNW